MKHHTVYRFLIITAWLIGAGLFLSPGTGWACDTYITLHDGAKDIYSAGDEVIFKIRIFLTHRNCPVGIEGTQFKVDGLKVLGATQWKNVSTGLYERFVKAQVLQTGKGESTLHVIRTCEKEGGYGKQTLKVTP